MAQSGGMLAGEGFLPPEAGLVVGAGVAALEEAGRCIGPRRPKRPTRRSWPWPTYPSGRGDREVRGGAGRRRGRRHSSAHHRRDCGGGSRPRGCRGLERPPGIVAAADESHGASRKPRPRSRPRRSRWHRQSLRYLPAQLVPRSSPTSWGSRAAVKERAEAPTRSSGAQPRRSRHRARALGIID